MIKDYAINTDSISILKTEILELADEAINKLYDIEKIVSDTNTYFKGDFDSIYQEKFNSLLANFPIIKSNIISYAVELERLSSSYKGVVDNINLTINKDINNIDTSIQ